MVESHTGVAVDHARLPFGVIADEIERRAGFAGHDVGAVRAVLQKLLEKRGAPRAARTGGARAAHERRRQSALDGVRGVIVQLVVFLRRAAPVAAAVGLVPQLPRPVLHLRLAIPFHRMRYPAPHQLRPLGIVLGWIRPALAVVRLGVVPRVRLGSGGKRLGHESDLDERPGAHLNVAVEDAVEDSPVVDRLAHGILGVGVGRAPLQGWGAIAGNQKMVSADFDRHGTQRGQFANQLLAVGRVRVVGLVVPEVRVDRAERAELRLAIHADLDGLLRVGQRQHHRKKSNCSQNTHDCL